MNDVYSSIDWIFNALKTIFLFMVGNWILAFIVLCCLLAYVINLVNNLRSK